MIFWPPLYFEILLIAATWILSIIAFSFLKKKNFKAVLFVLVIFLLLFLAALKIRSIKIGFILPDNATVFIGPDKNHIIKTEIPKNMRVQILSEKNNFYKISYDNDIGWVDKNDVSF